MGLKLITVIVTELMIVVFFSDILKRNIQDQIELEKKTYHEIIDGWKSFFKGCYVFYKSIPTSWTEFVEMLKTGQMIIRDAIVTILKFILVLLAITGGILSFVFFGWVGSVFYSYFLICISDAERFNAETANQ